MSQQQQQLACPHTSNDQSIALIKALLQQMFGDAVVDTCQAATTSVPISTSATAGVDTSSFSFVQLLEAPFSSSAMPKVALTDTACKPGVSEAQQQAPVASQGLDSWAVAVGPNKQPVVVVPSKQDKLHEQVNLGSVSPQLHLHGQNSSAGCVSRTKLESSNAGTSGDAINRNQKTSKATVQQQQQKHSNKKPASSPGLVLFQAVQSHHAVQNQDIAPSQPNQNTALTGQLLRLCGMDTDEEQDRNNKLSNNQDQKSQAQTVRKVRQGCVQITSGMNPNKSQHAALKRPLWELEIDPEKDEEEEEEEDDAPYGYMCDCDDNEALYMHPFGSRSRAQDDLQPRSKKPKTSPSSVQKRGRSYNRALPAPQIGDWIPLHELRPATADTKKQGEINLGDALATHSPHPSQVGAITCMPSNIVMNKWYSVSQLDTDVASLLIGGGGKKCQGGHVTGDHKFNLGKDEHGLFRVVQKLCTFVTKSPFYKPNGETYVTVEFSCGGCSCGIRTSQRFV